MFIFLIASRFQQAENDARLQEMNLRRQQAVAAAHGAQVAIEQDKKMSKILSQRQVEAVAQGTTVGSFSAITLNDMRNFSEDRKNLNTNLRMQQDIFKAKRSQVKSAKRQIPLITALNAATQLAMFDSALGGNSLVSYPNALGGGQNDVPYVSN